MAFSYALGTTPKEVFDNLNVDEKTRISILNVLYSEGYTATGICYAATVAEEKLYRFIGDNRFKSVFINEVRKNALKPGDPEWDKRKLRRINSIQKKIMEERNDNRKRSKRNS